jgi:hypothetical protein
MAWEAARSPSEAEGECICKGNWRHIVKETGPLIGRRFKADDGEYVLFGIVHGDDDYYYGMSKPGQLRLLSCVGSIEQHGFKMLPRPYRSGGD